MVQILSYKSGVFKSERLKLITTFYDPKCDLMELESKKLQKTPKSQPKKVAKQNSELGLIPDCKKLIDEFELFINWDGPQKDIPTP
jgi:hypothetical protein